MEVIHRRPPWLTGGYRPRFLPGVRKLRRLIETGFFGRILSVRPKILRHVEMHLRWVVGPWDAWALVTTDQFRLGAPNLLGA